MQPRRDDPRVVEDHQVAGPKRAQKIRNALVRQLRLAAGLHDEQPRAIARLRRPEGDQALRKFEIEVGELHRPAPS